MGYIAHHALVVTGCGDNIQNAHAKALEIFSTFDNQVRPVSPAGSSLVTGLMPGVVNSYETFAIVPDGSKEGWSDSDEGDRCRAELIAWLKRSDTYVDWALIRFGGDDYDIALVLDHYGAEPETDHP